MPARASVDGGPGFVGGRASSNPRGRKPRALGERSTEPRCYGRLKGAGALGGDGARAEMSAVGEAVGRQTCKKSAYGESIPIADGVRRRGKRALPGRSGQACGPLQVEGVCFAHGAHSEGGARMCRGRGMTWTMVMGAPQCRQMNVGGGVAELVAAGATAGVA